MSDIPVDSAFCYSCSKQTNHQILATHSYHTDPNDYYMVFDYQIIRCMGCSDFAFRLLETDVEELRYYPDEERKSAIKNHQRENIYPKNIKQKYSYWDLPETVYRIHSETVLAINEGADTLAVLGLRAILEAICQDKKMKGDLEEKINQLLEHKFITERDANRLHSIRFLGNDVAHEIIKAEKHQIQVALTIIEYLIGSIYILEKQIAGKLPDIYDIFLKDLKSKLNNYKKQKFSIQHLSKKKRPDWQIREITNRLKSDIKNGKINYIQLSNDEDLPFEKIQETPNNSN